MSTDRCPQFMTPSESRPLDPGCTVAPTMSDPVPKRPSAHALEPLSGLVTDRFFMHPRDYGMMMDLHPCPHCGYFPDDLILDGDAFESAMDVHAKEYPDCLIHTVHNL